MNNTKLADANSASITKLIFENKLEDLFLTYGPEVMIAFLKKATSDDPNFGQKGYYSFFCNKCGGNWNFETKQERAIFEKLHKLAECGFKWQSAQGRRKTGGFMRGSKPFHPANENTFKELINALETNNAGESTDATTVVPEIETPADAN